MSFYHFPSEFVFWDKVENHDEIKKEILPKILEDSKNKKTIHFIIVNLTQVLIIMSNQT
jgi:hypothetical protein